MNRLNHFSWQSYESLPDIYDIAEKCSLRNWFKLYFTDDPYKIAFRGMRTATVCNNECSVPVEDFDGNEYLLTVKKASGSFQTTIKEQSSCAQILDIESEEFAYDLITPALAESSHKVFECCNQNDLVPVYFV